MPTEVGMESSVLPSWQLQVWLDDTNTSIGSDVVIDDYLIGHEQETKYRKWACKILVIDDLCKIKNECDILLYPNFGTNKEDYKKLLPEDCKIYTGINYFAFDKDILKFRKKSINKKLRKILVINGFYDKKNIIPSIVNDIFNNCKNVELNIIIGKKKKEILTLKKNNNLNIFSNPNEKLHNEKLRFSIHFKWTNILRINVT